MVSDKKIFQDFHYVRLYKISDHSVGAIVWPQGYNLNNLGRRPLGVATYPIW